MLKKIWLTCFATTLICSGCRPALVNLPAMPDCPKPVTQEPVQCPALAMPDPIPKVMHITLEPGKVEADSGGEKMLRDYAELRRLIKKTWHE